MLMNKETLKVVSVTALLFTFLYTGASLDAVSQEISIYARYALLVISVLTSIMVFIKTKAIGRRAHFITLSILIFGILQFPIYQLSVDFSERLLTDLQLCLLSIFVAYLCSGAQFSSKVKIYDLSIALIVLYLAALILISSIKFDGYIPVLGFSYIPGQDRLELYSQGVSEIFSVAVLAIVFKVCNEKMSIFLSSALIFLSVCFFVLALAGGSRGEVMLCVVVLIFIVCRSWKSILISLGVLTTLFFVVNHISETSDYLTQLPSVWRLLAAYEKGSLGERDALLAQSLSLLSANPRCFLFGCGLGYFQEYYSYEYGRYPHNWLLEAVITFGAPLLMLGMFLIVLSIVKNYRYFRENEKFLLMLSLYFFGISLKSGSLIGDSLLYGSVLPLLFFTGRPQTARFDVEPNLKPTTELAAIVHGRDGI